MQIGRDWGGGGDDRQAQNNLLLRYIQIISVDDGIFPSNLTNFNRFSKSDVLMSVRNGIKTKSSSLPFAHKKCCYSQLSHVVKSFNLVKDFLRQPI